MESKKAQQPKNNENRCNHSKHVVNSLTRAACQWGKPPVTRQHGCRFRIRAWLRLPDKRLEKLSPKTHTGRTAIHYSVLGSQRAMWRSLIWRNLGGSSNATKRIAGPRGFPSPILRPGITHSSLLQGSRFRADGLLSPLVFTATQLSNVGSTLVGGRTAGLHKPNPDSPPPTFISGR